MLPARPPPRSTAQARRQDGSRNVAPAAACRESACSASRRLTSLVRAGRFTCLIIVSATRRWRRCIVRARSSASQGWTYSMCAVSNLRSFARRGAVLSQALPVRPDRSRRRRHRCRHHRYQRRSYSASLYCPEEKGTSSCFGNAVSFARSWGECKCQNGYQLRRKYAARPRNPA